MFRPCALFPGEVEDYFCMDCKKPCSALALLVGPHTNHRRESFEAALLALPNECLSEAMELKKCSEILLAHEGIQTFQQLTVEKTAAEEEVLEIERQMTELQQRREKLLATVGERQTAIEKYQTETAQRVRSLCETAENQLSTIQSLREIYQHQEAVNFEQGRGGASNNMLSVSLSELKSIEEVLRAEASNFHQWQVSGGFTRGGVGAVSFTQGVEGENQKTSERLNTASEVLLASAGGKGSDELLHHVLLNQEKLPHPLSSAGLSTSSPAVRSYLYPTIDDGLTPRPATRGNVASHGGAGGAGVSVGRENTVASEIDTLAAVMGAKRKATVSPPTTDDEYDAPSSTTVSNSMGATLTPEQRTLKRREASPLLNKSKAEYSPSPGATGCAGTNHKSPSRFLRQYKRVRQCMRDAMVADQQPLVTSLLHAVHELRREARGCNVTDVERAISLDLEMQELM